MPRGPRTVLPLAVLAGLAVALAVTLLQPDVHRASGAVLLAAPGAPPRDDGSLDAEARAAAELLESRVVAESAATNLALGLSASDVLDRVDARAREGSSVVRLAVEDGEADRARRIAQEVAEVFVALFNDRFGEAATASIWDPPRAEEGRVSPRPVRNLALGALAGLLAGAAYLALAARRGQTRDASVPAPARAQTAAVRAPVGSRPEATHAPTLPPEPEPSPAPPGEFTVQQLERVLAEHGDAFPERREELAVYLDSLRGVAGPDGRLPEGVGAIVEEVFGDLIRRDRA